MIGYGIILGITIKQSRFSSRNLDRVFGYRYVKVIYPIIYNCACRRRFFNSSIPETMTYHFNLWNEIWLNWFFLSLLAFLSSSFRFFRHTNFKLWTLYLFLSSFILALIALHLKLYVVTQTHFSPLKANDFIKSYIQILFKLGPE